MRAYRLMDRVNQLIESAAGNHSVQDVRKVYGHNGGKLEIGTTERGLKVQRDSRENMWHEIVVKF